MSHAGKNHAPLDWRNVSPEKASRGLEQYNNESTYNEYSNNQAFEHLKSLQSAVGIIAQHPALEPQHAAPLIGNPANPSDESNNYTIGAAVRHHNSKFVGDTLESVQAGDAPSGIGARAIVGAIKTHLGTIKSTNPELSMQIHSAMEHADNYLKSYTPAYLDTNDKNKKTSGETGVSVVVDPEYRKVINADPKTTADGRYAKTAQYEANKKATGYKKPVKTAQGE